MRTIVIGDIHGCYNELKKLIMELEENQEYNKNTDRLIFLGDYIDRGFDSDKVIKYIRELQEENENVIALMGNHEDMMLDYFDFKNMNWKMNGFRTTINSYANNKEQLLDDIEWIKTLPLYFEDEYFIYVHAGINPNKDFNAQDKYDLLWIRDDFVYDTKKFDKRVIFGHTPSLLVTAEDKPYYTYTDNICIDTGCVFGGKLTALIINDDKIEKFYQVSKETE